MIFSNALYDEIDRLKEENEKLRENLERVCFVALGHGVITRMLCSRMLNIGLPDLDDWFEKEGAKP